jgi:hypothetical protein
MKNTLVLTFPSKEKYEQAKAIIARIKSGDPSYRLPGQALALLSNADIQTHDKPTSPNPSAS